MRQTDGHSVLHTFKFTHFKLASNITTMKNRNTKISNRLKKYNTGAEGLELRGSGRPELVLGFPSEWVQCLISQYPFPYP